MSINWDYPALRKGFGGVIDGLIGPGATRAEKRLQTIIPAMAAVAALFYALWVDTGWSLLQQIMCAYRSGYDGRRDH